MTAALLAAAFRRFNEGDLPGACVSFYRLAALAPHRTDHYFHTALMEHHLGNLNTAADLYARALAVDPSNVAAHVNRGLVCHLLARFEEAETHARAALETAPECAEAWSNLGNSLQQLRRLGEAEKALVQALHLRPTFGDAMNNLGNVWLDMGRAQEAVEIFDEAARLNKHRESDFNSVFGRLYVEPDPSFIYDRAVKTAQRQLSARSKFTHVKRERQKPRLGFISGDFRHHPVGLCIIRTMEFLKERGFDLVFYTTTPLEDVWSWRFQECGAWTPAYRLNDEQLTQRIHDDQIDILFDLSGYTAGHRLEVFARKPAPIQATWFAYPGTTGLPEMDYLIGEPVQTSGLQPYCSEKIVELPTIVCFEPPDHEPLPELPAVRNGFVTFGSFNVLKKVTPDVIRVWSDILNKCPTSRLIMKTPALDCHDVRTRYESLFASHGVDIARLSFYGHTDSAGHRKVMSECDVALDTFPYSGGVTTLECLWMGLPVITLKGDAYQSRHSSHYLQTINFKECICYSEEDYIDLACFLAGKGRTDVYLRAVRTQDVIRQRMLASPLCDISLHGTAFEQAVMTMWRD